MADFPFALVGFDLDGTLLDTSGDLAAAVNHALASVGREPLTVDQVRPMVGGGARHMLAQGLAASGGGDDAMLDQLQARLLSHYEVNIAVHTRPFPNVLEALDELSSRGVALAVVTNKIERFAETLLSALGLRQRFACVLGGDSLGPGRGKPKPDLLEAMLARSAGGPAAFVGDSIYDVEAAHAAGLPVIACSFGFLDRPVATLGADAIIDDFSALVPTLELLATRG